MTMSGTNMNKNKCSLQPPKNIRNAFLVFDQSKTLFYFYKVYL